MKVYQKIEKALEAYMHAGYTVRPEFVIMSARTADVMDAEFRGEIYEYPMTVVMLDGDAHIVPKIDPAKYGGKRVDYLCTEYGELGVVKGDVPDGTFILGWGG